MAKFGYYKEGGLAGSVQLIDQFEGNAVISTDAGVVRILDDKNKQIGAVYLRPSEWIKEIK